MTFGSGKRGWRGKRASGRGFLRDKKQRSLEPRGQPGTCICPECRFNLPHQPGLPCFRTKCPQCGSAMTRRFFVEE